MFNALIAKTLPIVPKSIVKAVAKRYIAGDTLNDAVQTTKRLEKAGATATIDVLGEFVRNREEAEHSREMSAQVVEAIRQHKLPAYLSVKLTSLGLDIDKQFGYENVKELVEQAKQSKIFVRMDMENTPYTDTTLKFYKRLREDGYDNVGVVIQAYLKRSEKDIKSLIDYNASVRLCKGIYVESPDVAFKNPDEIRANYKKLLKILIENQMPVGIATHDDNLISFAEQYIKGEKISKKNYEFQMLLGVREDRRDDLIKKEHKVRIYVPFGDDWYGYSTRRLKENPQIAGYVLKALLTGK
ncbi:MAG TPA: proline dehydrogenase family protein [Patescibacteria group bacterium]|nr:proline dehydrogenase family protein [Patescibacteria group bacterium]